MANSIFAFSADPGGARCLLPVIRELEKSFSVVILAKGTGLSAFEAAGCSPVLLHSEQELDTLLASLSSGASLPASPVLVLTSASSLPEVDMTEKRLWAWAEQRGIASVAILDQWQNLERRFSYPDRSRVPLPRPSKIAVMDDAVRTEMLALGFSADQIVITGQPYLEWSLMYANAGEAAGRARVRRQMGVKGGERIVCFVVEPIAMLYGREATGFDEFSVIEEVLVALGTRGQEDCRIRLWIKLHPKSFREDFGQLRARAAQLHLTLDIIQNELSPEEALWGSDLVVGMSSLLLVQAALLGRPVVSAQIGARIGQPDMCYLSRRGLIPRVTQSPELRHFLDLLVEDSEFTRKYLARQGTLDSHNGAAIRAATLCMTLIRESQVRA